MYSSHKNPLSFRESYLFLKDVLLHFFLVLFLSKTVANKATPSVCTQMGIFCVNPGKHIDILKYAWQKEFITSRCDLPFGSGASCRLPGSLKGQRRAHRRHVFVHGEPKTLKVAWNRYVAATYRIWTGQVLNFRISARKLSSVHNFSQNGCQANPYYCTGQRQRFQNLKCTLKYILQCFLQCGDP